METNLYDFAKEKNDAGVNAIVNSPLKVLKVGQIISEIGGITLADAGVKVLLNLGGVTNRPLRFCSRVFGSTVLSSAIVDKTKDTYKSYSEAYVKALKQIPVKINEGENSNGDE